MVSTQPAAPAHDADVANRRAWLSLLLYPLTFALAFVVGEGLITLFGYEPLETPPVWVVLAAGTPALLVFVMPGILSVRFGRRAMRLGNPNGLVPAVIGGVIGAGFVGVNVLSYVVGLLAS